MAPTTDLAARFLALHQGPEPLLLANAWDVGTAKALAALGFQALATTSAGHAATLGRKDGNVTRDEALAHAADRWPRPTCRSAPTSRTASATRPTRWPRRCGWRSRSGSPAARSRTTTARRSTTRAWPGSGWPPRSRRHARPAGPHRPGREPHPRRPGPRRHDRPAAVLPGGGRRRALRARADGRRPTSAGWSSRSTGRSTCSPCRAPRRSPSWARSASGASRSAAASRLVAYGALVQAGRELLDQGTYGWWATAAHTAGAGRRLRLTVSGTWARAWQAPSPGTGASRARPYTRTMPVKMGIPADQAASSPPFKVVSDFSPAGDQPKAIEATVRRHPAGRALPDAARHHRLGQDAPPSPGRSSRCSGPPS